MQPATPRRKKADATPLEGVEPPEFFLAILNRRIRDLMDQALRPHGLKLVEWRLLDSLATSRALTVCELSELAVTERTVTSRLIDRLAERGLVSKTVSETDRRFARIELTRAGQNAIAKSRADVTDAREQLFSGFEKEQLVALNELTRRLLANSDHYNRRV